MIASFSDILVDVIPSPAQPCVPSNEEVQVQMMPEVVTPPPAVIASTVTNKRKFTATNEQATGSPTIKKKAVDCMADRIISRKNMKDRQDRELHEKKLKLMSIEEEIKVREEQSSRLVLDNMKKCHTLVEQKCEIELQSAKLEQEIKIKELENINIDNEIKKLDLKIKQLQYKQLMGNNGV